VVTCPLGDRVAKGNHCGAQAGHQGPRGVAAEFPRVASHFARQPLRNAIRWDVVQLVAGGVGMSQCSTGSNQTMWLPPELLTEGAVGATGGDGSGGNDPAAPVTTVEADGSVPALG